MKKSVKQACFASILAAALVVPVIGCGDSDDDSSEVTNNVNNNNENNNNNNNENNVAGKGEFEQCMRMSECADPLVCVVKDNYGIEECLMPCTSDEECTGEGNVCVGFSETEGYCGNRIEQDGVECNFGLGGLDLCSEDQDEANGDYSTCLSYGSDGPSICTRICTLPGDGQCDEGEECVGGLLTNEAKGICGQTAAAGEDCDVESQIFCDDTSTCLILREGESAKCQLLCTEDPSVCAEDETCYELSETRSACIPNDVLNG